MGRMALHDLGFKASVLAIFEVDRLLMRPFRECILDLKFGFYLVEHEDRFWDETRRKSEFPPFPSHSPPPQHFKSSLYVLWVPGVLHALPVSQMPFRLAQGGLRLEVGLIMEKKMETTI